jgi:Zn-dependent peptidase ImmA (M78 family)
MNNLAIEKAAADLWRRTNSLSAPVEIELVAKSLGVIIRKERLDDEVSGMLIIKGDAKHIFVNLMHHENRQRFTVAHEIGHLKLHYESGDQLFLDKKYLVYERAAKSQLSDGETLTTPQQEREANLFAANLLMPIELIQDTVRRRRLDLRDEWDVTELAGEFGVSEQAMSIRLQRVKILSLPPLK